MPDKPAPNEGPEQPAPAPPSGIHHVTGIAKDPQDNLDFYAGVLGLRLVKRTVNFDDPSTWHLYYADVWGSPGSVLTFFPYPQAARGVEGTGIVTETVLAIPAPSLDWWAARFERAGVAADRSTTEEGGERVAVRDPAGMRIALDGSARSDDRMAGAAIPWPDGPVPLRHAIRGIAGVRLLEDVADTDGATWLLGDVLGWREAQGSAMEPVPTTIQGSAHARSSTAPTARDPESRVRLRPPVRGAGSPAGSWVEIAGRATTRPGRVAAGSVQHVALRVPDETAQEAWRAHISAQRVFVTEIKDRQYFRSIYFREPGGVLLELATDGPGFAVDESPHALGERLCLPPWLETQRAQIEATLPAIDRDRALAIGRDLSAKA